MNINKATSTLYLFDLDGTICGDNRWKSLWANNVSCLKNGPYINPNKEYDIRWSILTGRPKIDLPFIKFLCLINGMTPSNIITQNRWLFGKGTTNIDICKFKVEVIKDILDGKIILDNQPTPVDKVFYIDNDLTILPEINSRRRGYPIMAMTLLDFNSGNFNIIF